MPVDSGTRTYEFNNIYDLLLGNYIYTSNLGLGNTIDGFGSIQDQLMITIQIHHPYPTLA